MFRWALILAMLVQPLLACPAPGRAEACNELRECCCYDACGCAINPAPAQAPAAPAAAALRQVEPLAALTPSGAVLCFAANEPEVHPIPLTVADPFASADRLRPLICVWLT